MRYLYALEIAALILLSVYGANATEANTSVAQEEPIAESFVQPLGRCAEDTPLTHTAAESSAIIMPTTAAAKCVTETYVYKLPPVKLQCKQILKDLGYGPVQIAAILGNIQVESCFRPRIYGFHNGKIYYGLFQWNLNYTPQAEGMTVTEQCLLMHETIERQFKTHPGPVTYEDFMNCTSSAIAAEWFAKYFERCGKNSYEKRAQAAQLIYDELYGKE